MRAVFRFDASAALGAGHAYRCMTLAEALTRLGWSCHCLVNREAAATVPQLKNNPSFTLSDATDAAPEKADWLIVDHYQLDAEWEASNRGWADRILVIDDLADRPHDCDILLDQTLGREEGDYAGLVPADSRLLTGSDYALLRPAFARARQAATARRAGAEGVKRILVSLGATDPENHSLLALQANAESGLAVAVDVVLGAGAPHLPAIRAQVAGMTQKTRLHVEVNNMPELLARADLAIGAAGSSTWERCCLGLPSLMLVIAENQRMTAEAVAAAGAARLIAGPREGLAGQIAAALKDLASDAAALRDLSSKAAGICDGRGSDRVGLALVPPGQAKDGRRVALRLATAEDEDRVLEWQSHPTTRRFSRNPAIPTAAEHHQWFTARLADPECLLSLIILDGAPAGVLRLDSRAPATQAPEAPVFEISILVAPDYRGLGIALEALHYLRRWQGAATIAATVLAGNDASAALFRAAGYQTGADGLLYSYPAQSAMTVNC